MQDAVVLRPPFILFTFHSTSNFRPEFSSAFLWFSLWKCLKMQNPLQSYKKGDWVLSQLLGSQSSPTTSPHFLSTGPTSYYLTMNYQLDISKIQSHPCYFLILFQKPQQCPKYEINDADFKVWYWTLKWFFSMKASHFLSAFCLLQWQLSLADSFSCDHTLYGCN